MTQDPLPVPPGPSPIDARPGAPGDAPPPRDTEAEVRAAASEQRDVLYRLALSLTGDRHRADDAVQRGVVTALVYHARLAPRSTAEAFLRGIVCNLARRPRVQTAQDACLDLDDLSEDVEPPTTEPLAERRLQQLQRHELLEQILDRLPPPQAAVLRHMHLAGRTSTATAKLLGRTRGWVEKTRERALARLRRVFREADPDSCLFRGRSLDW